MNRNSLLAMASCLALLANAVDVVADDPPQTDTAKPKSETTETPLTVFRAYADAHLAGKYKEAANWLHPQAKERVRVLFGPILKAELSTRQRDQILVLFDVPNLDALRNASAEELFDRMAHGFSDHSAEFKQAARNAQVTPLGSVVEASGEIHVVYRTVMQVGETTTNRVAVVTLKDTPNGPRLLLEAEYEDGMRQLVELLERSS